ncbi:GNAT family N-acetyltransferase [Fontibacillus phaseoli]|uniref:GNAT family N-acetyltransferase n=1 Tax=Fontibacillus phaseoli TaxID=1416533 RepID=UPI000DF4B65A
MEFQENGYGKLQLQEAINRITQNNVKIIVITTNNDLIPAQRMYESVGFTICQRRKKQHVEHIDYVYIFYSQ